MKKLFLFLVLVSIFLKALPQKGQLGIQANPIATIINNNLYNNLGYLPGDLYYAQFKIGYKLGLNYSYLLKHNWELMPCLSYNYLSYSFKQNLYNGGNIASSSYKVSYGSFELSLIAKKYLKLNDNQLFALKLGGGFASNDEMAVSSRSSLTGDSAMSISSGTGNFGITYTPRVIAGISIISTDNSSKKLEIGLTYYHSFKPVSGFQFSNSINNMTYCSLVTPILSYISLDIIYYLKPFKCKKGS